MADRKLRGNSLAQYIIILACVCMFVLVGYQFLGDRIVALLTGYSNNVDSMKNQISANYEQDQAMLSGGAGSLGGTPENPVKSCSGDVCTIDFGDYILKGIPSNFDSLIETSGTSGGNNAVLALFDQIADQLEENGDAAGALEYRDLANLGHFIANIQNEGEQEASACSSASDVFDCYIDVLNTENSVSIPENIQEFLPELDMAYTDYNHLQKRTLIGEARHQKNVNINIFNDTLPRNPAYNFVDKYDAIMNNPNYSSQLKNLTTALYSTIDQLSFNNTGEVLCLTTSSPQRGQSRYDAITGDFLGTTEFEIDSELKDITTPQTSVNNDLNSIVICALGNNSDPGHECIN